MPKPPASWRSRIPHRTGLFAALALLFATFLAGQALGASFQVSPTRFEFSLDKRFTNFFTVTNQSPGTVRLRTYLAFLDVSENNALVPVQDHPLDLSPYVVINPRKFSLGAGGKRVVRFSVRPPPNLPDGEYRVVVFFDELPSGSGEPTEEASTAPGSLGSVRIKLLTRLGITLYGMKGDKAPALSLEEGTLSEDDQGVVVRGVAVNTGNVRVTLDLAARLEGAGERVIGATDTKLVVQRSQRLPFQLRLPKPGTADYRVLLTGSDGERVYFEQALESAR